MNKKIITATAVLAASLLGAWYWRFRKKRALEESEDTVEAALSRSEVP